MVMCGQHVPRCSVQAQTLTHVALCCLALVCGQMATHESNVSVSNLQPNPHTALVHANAAAAAAAINSTSINHTCALHSKAAPAFNSAMLLSMDAAAVQ